MTRDKKHNPFNIIIPAAGMGYRMKSHGPKALTPVGKTTLIERQIRMLRKQYKAADIFVVVGFEANKIRKQLKNYAVRFIYNPIHDTSNVLFSIGLALQCILGNRALIVYGDLIFNYNAIRHLNRGKSKIIIDTYEQFKHDEVGVNCQDDEVTTLAFGLPEKWSQIVFVRDKELELLREISVNKDTVNWFGYEGLNHVVDRGGCFDAVKTKHLKVLDVDYTKDIDSALKWKYS